MGPESCLTVSRCAACPNGMLDFPTCSEIKAQHDSVDEVPEPAHAVLQVADGLHFLHTQANQIHRSISPETMCITASGAWKLAGFGLAMLAEFGSSNPAEAAFDYSDSSSSVAAQALKVAQPTAELQLGHHCYVPAFMH